MILSSSSSAPVARPLRQCSSWYSRFWSMHMLRLMSLCTTTCTSEVATSNEDHSGIESCGVVRLFAMFV